MTTNNCNGSGCANHGCCIDQQVMKQLFDKTTYQHDSRPSLLSSASAEKRSPSIDFEKELQALQDLLANGKNAEYDSKLQEIANFIMQNSQANRPSSLRTALRLPASAAFATWSDETAHSELAFCNTDALKQL